MKHTKLTIVAILLCTLLSCDKENTPADKSGLDVTGYWINPDYSANQITYTKTYALQENEYGLSLKADQSLIERKNAGWCGTPPITYGDFEGSWSQNDSTIYIKVGYWGGKEQREWKLKSIDSKKLTIEIIDYAHIPEE